MIEGFSQVANDLAPAIFLVVGVTVMVFIGRQRRQELSRPVALSDGQTYAAFVTAGSRPANGSAAFNVWKNGFGGVLMTVTPNAIVVTASGGGVPALSRRLGVHYQVNPAEVSMSTGLHGWGGTFLGAKDSVVLTPRPGVRGKEVAVRPLDGDLARLQAALRDVGVLISPGAEVALAQSGEAEPARFIPEPRVRGAIGFGVVGIAFILGAFFVFHAPLAALMAIPAFGVAGLQLITARRERRP
ncbi:MAG TPA: hypothetical protein VFA37_10790 [Gaiellaceae bacterium]|nr:hypothetical protein [Gaiellaceae bacterium]